MKMKKLGFSLKLALISAVFLLATEVPVAINTVAIQSGLLQTKVIIQGTAPLPSPMATYLKDNPRTLIVTLQGVDSSKLPPIISTDDQLINSAEIRPGGEKQVNLLIHLKEQVPFSIFRAGKEVGLELTRILRGEAIELPEQNLLFPGTSVQENYLENVSWDLSTPIPRLRLQLPGEVSTRVFALDKPLRLVVDLFGTRYPNLTTLPLNRDGIEKVRIAQFKETSPWPITRIVFDLKEVKPYSIVSGKNELIISFPSSSFSSEDAFSAETSQPKLKSPAMAAGFEMKALATSTPPSETKAMMEETSQSSAVIDKASAQEKPKEKVTQETQVPKKFEPKVIAAVEEKYSGELITLRFKDADLRDVILYLGEFAGLNVIFDPDVRGTVTCDLRDVPWDQALDLILRNNKLGKVIEGNVLRVAPISTLTREDEEQRRLKESKELAGPIVVKTITLSYSKARDVQSLLMTKKSPRGEIIIDERTNTLIISDVKENLDLLEKLISVLDTPTPQVSIEARIVEATSTFIRNLGIQWGYRAVADPFYGNPTSLEFPHKILADGSIIPQGIVTKGIGGPLGGYAVNLPAPAFTTAVSFSLANVLDTFRLDLALSALETSGEGRIISCPKITTQNNQAAEIIQGRQIPVQTVANFTVTTRYVNAALELRATPQITAEGTIIMTLEIQNNAADFANLVAGIPPITTQSARTTVMVPDGGTTVIGGIYRSEDSITRERVPFLNQIPILGKLFRSFARTKENRELLIFITPRIIK
ncbi:MAG: type IV pilus secretin PilQ [Candidatus Aminicenantes bacterium]|nr:type IV pilus secretin PilQ [Candidatus Aminicenantes bacterium]